MSTSISAGQCTDKGIKTENQDACGIRVPGEPLLSSKGIVIAIADGVSSSAGGREASESSVKGLIHDYYSTSETWSVKHSAQRVLGALNRWLHGQGHQAFNSSTGMLTTLSAIVIKSSTAHIFHIGDSRIYRLRENQLECLTRDHQTRINGERSFLSRAMGADLHVEIDYKSIAIEKGDCFLLTTDGVHDFVSEHQMKEIVDTQKEDPENAAHKLVEKALENQSNDNVSCQVVHINEILQQKESEFYQTLTELPFPPPLETGMILDGYKIVRELHASKKTQVYLAIDTETQEQVVIKTPSVNYQDDPAYIERFLHEEWAGRRIHQENVMKVLAPKSRRKFLYYVTEYLQGQTLRMWMNDHPKAEISEVRELIQQVVKGVRAFHRLEMLHQDLKPENIMIDSHGTVKIIDFGSTHIAGIQERPSLIKQEYLLGTLDYAAPEYFLGRPGSNQSDLYSLATITYEMLSGKLPYRVAFSEKNIQRLKYHPIMETNPDVPNWVDGALAQATTVSLEFRTKNLSEFIQNLIQPNPDLIRPQPLIERNPIVVWQSISGFLLILVIYLLYLLFG